MSTLSVRTLAVVLLGTGPSLLAGCGPASPPRADAAYDVRTTSATAGARMHLEMASAEIAMADRVTVDLEQRVLAASSGAAIIARATQGRARGKRHVVTDLRMALQYTEQHAAAARTHGLSNTFAQLLRTSSRIRVRSGQAFSPEDYALVKKDLELQSRTDAVVASTTALLAAYQAVDHGGDPKGLEAVAEATLASLPAKPTFTDAAVDVYVKELPAALSAFRPRAESQMRATFGNAEFETVWRPRQDALFEYVATANEDANDASKARIVAAHAADPRDESDTLSVGQLATALGVGSVEVTLRGAQALKNGDARGAIDAAVELTPVPALKQAWGLASSLLFAQR